MILNIMMTLALACGSVGVIDPPQTVLIQPVINTITVKEVDIIATAYDDDTECSGKWGSKTASGGRTHEGIVAAPRNVPFGTIIDLGDLGTFKVEDRGSAIKWVDDHTMKVDVWMPSHSAAVEFGVKRIKGKVVTVK